MLLMLLVRLKFGVQAEENRPRRKFSEKHNRDLDLDRRNLCNGVRRM